MKSCSMKKTEHICDLCEAIFQDMPIACYTCMKNVCKSCVASEKGCQDCMKNGEYYCNACVDDSVEKVRGQYTCADHETFPTDEALRNLLGWVLTYGGG